MKVRPRRFKLVTSKIKKQNVKFLQGAIALMHRLKYPQKFGLISLVFILPISLLMYLLFSETQSRIDFTAKEKLGNAYLRPLQQLSRQIPRLQFLNNDALAEEKFADEIDLELAQINRTLQSLEAIDRERGETLQTKEYFLNLKQDWETLQNNQRLWS